MYIIPIFFFLLVSFPARAQFRQFSTTDGLSDNSVNVVYQDRYGLLWFGTEVGLNRFDGYSFTVFHHDPSDSASLSEDNVISIVEDGSGNLWIGTAAGGLNLYQRGDNSFRRFEHHSTDPAGLPDNFVKCLLPGRRGDLWIGTGSGFSSFDIQRHTFVNHLPGKYVKALYEDSGGRLWIGTGFDGLFRYEPEEGRLVRFMHDPSDPYSPTVNAIESIAEDSLGNIWIGTLGGGLLRYNDAGGRFHPCRIVREEGMAGEAGTVYSLFCGRDGILWAGTENHGLKRIRVERQGSGFGISIRSYSHDKNDPSSLSNNTVRSVFEDRTGNLWIGTFSGGIHLLSKYKKPFHNFRTEPFNRDGLSHNIVRCFLEDRPGNLWIGTDGGGLNYLERRSGRFIHFTHDPEYPSSISDDHILDLYRDSAGSLWIATWNGLNRFDVSGRRFIRYHSDPADARSLSSDKTTSVIVDESGHVWVGTISGLNVLDTRRGGVFRGFEGAGSVLRDRYILCLYLDSEGNIWAGTVWGLFMLPRESRLSKRYEFTAFYNVPGDSGSLSNSQVFSILEDSSGMLWVATLNGLNRFDPETRTFHSWSVRDGLPSSRIASVVEDGDGAIWVGTHRGIARLYPSSGSVTCYDSRDGLVGDDFARAAARLAGGELAFGAKTGFTVFPPDSIPFCPVVPPVVLTGFYVQNREMPISGVLKQRKGQVRPDSLEIELSHDQNVFSFEFAALDFTAPEKNQYQYRMEGFDPEWRKTGPDRRFAGYTNLPAGRYVFRAKGSNCDGVWNERGLFVAVRIFPPFWRSGWAVAIYTALILAALYLLRRLVLFRERMKTELQFERREAERIHELDAMKLRFFTNISHEFKTPVTLIIGLLERLMAEKGVPAKRKLLKSHQSLMRNATRLLRLINQIMDIRKLESGGMRLDPRRTDIVVFARGIYSSFKDEADQRRIQYRFTSFTDHFHACFDPDKIEKVIFNILSNAFKYTGDGGSIRLDVSRQDGRPDGAGGFLAVRIEDNGIGIPEEYLDKIFDPFVRVERSGPDSRPGTGLGLSFAKEMMALHGGSLEVASKEGAGSCFTVKIPLTAEPEGEVAAGKREEECGKNFSGEKPADERKEPALPGTPLILIADDDLDFINFLKEELESDFRVIEAYDGQSALESAVKYMPDLIISDVRMPKMDGFALCSAVKRNEKTAHVPLILLTSQAGEKSHIQGFDLGADDYIEKPFDRLVLHSRVLNLMESRRVLREHFSHEIYLQPRNIPITSEDERFLNRVLACLEKLAQDPDFSVSRLGSEVGLSRVQLYRRIKSVTGMTPNDLIRDFRLKRSAQLITKSRLTISEIAYRVGFRDPSYFCRCFRQHYGLTPLEFARHAKPAGPAPESAG
jgi:signal transduction histidine kinase/ligand-binding sensor domain-containing protein/DNA-binding response OmpR family regulator